MGPCVRFNIFPFMCKAQEFFLPAEESGVIYNRGGCTVKHCGEPITDPKMEARGGACSSRSSMQGKLVVDVVVASS